MSMRAITRTGNGKCVLMPDERHEVVAAPATRGAAAVVLF